MEITSLGLAAFRIKGKTATVVTDPYTPSHAGGKFPKHITADVVTVSRDHPDHHATNQVEGTAYVVNGPGEYEIKGVGVIGRKIEQTTIYHIELDGLSIVHLGALPRALSAEDVDSLDGVDILMVPVGAFAAAVINEIDPSIVIPMSLGTDGATVKDFLKEIGKEDVVPQAKLTVTRDKLPEQMQVVILE